MDWRDILILLNLEARILRLFFEKKVNVATFFYFILGEVLLNSLLHINFFSRIWSWFWCKPKWNPEASSSFVWIQCETKREYGHCTVYDQWFNIKKFTSGSEWFKYDIAWFMWVKLSAGIYGTYCALGKV